MPQETILRVLHNALAESRADVDALIDRLISVYHGKESLERTEQVIALGFLVCARAMRESSLMQEIAVREELQDLHRVTADILEAVHRTQRAIELEREAILRRREPRQLTEDLKAATAGDAD